VTAPRISSRQRDTDATPSARGRWTRPVVGGVLATALWAVLASLRPEVTYHLAPAVVVLAVPYLHGRNAGRRTGLAATAVGAVLALVAAGVLRAAGRLEGPVLVGGDAFGEAVLVTLAAAVVTAAAVVGVVREPARRDDDPVSPTTDR
jgi:hypothetical protein